MIIIKRPKKLLILIIVPLIYLMLVLLNITTFKSGQYGYMAANQRIEKISAPRGIIADRNMLPFTGSDARYNESSLAKHAIGYTDSFGNGLSGIEKEFNRELTPENAHSQPSIKDAKGNSIAKFKASDTSNTIYIKLTLDYHIQNLTENVLDDYNIVGSAVVLSTDSFDILATASRPDFNQNRLEEYLKEGGSALINRAETAYSAAELKPYIVEEKITPLNAAKAAACAASDGVEMEINLADSITDEKGNIIKNLRKTNKMQYTMQIPVTVTGNVWAVGYFPKDAPKYALAIVTENPAPLNEIFDKIQKKILALNRY